MHVHLPHNFMLESHIKNNLVNPLYKDKETVSRAELAELTEVISPPPIFFIITISKLLYLYIYIKRRS